MKKSFFYIQFLSLLLIGFNTQIIGQIPGSTICFDENDAFIGLDRKRWTSQVANLSESFQFDFIIPDSPFDCHGITRVDVEIDFSETSNLMDPACFLGFWTHALLCDNNDPIGCPNNTIVYDKMGLNSNFSINDDLVPGDNLGIDVVVVIVPTNPSCSQTPISDGLYSADVEVCITIYYELLEPEIEIDLGDDINVCPEELVDLEGPSGFEDYEWQGPIDSDEQNLLNAPPGLYVLDAYDANGCKSSDDIVIIASDPIDISFNLMSPILICSGSSELLSTSVNSITGNSMFSYSWESPSGEFTNGSDILLSQVGDYTLIVTDLNNQCTNTATFRVNEVSIAHAQIDSLSFDQINICEGEVVSLEAFVPFNDTNNYAFQWIVSNDTFRIPNILISEGDSIILNMLNQLGCPSSSDTLVIIEEVPNIAGFGNNATICSGDVYDLNLLLSSNAFTNGVWINSNDQIITDGVFNSTGLSGINTLRYIVENIIPCPNDTAFFSIIINDSNVDAGEDIQTVACQQDIIELNNLITGDPGGQFFDSSSNPLANSNLDLASLSSGTVEITYIVESTTCGIDQAVISIDILEAIPPTIVSGPICEHDEIIVNGEIYNASNSIGSQTLQSQNSCDSLIEINLTFFSSSEANITSEHCLSEIVIIGGEIFDSSNSTGMVLMPGSNVNGCDSIINVSLNFIETIENNISMVLCETQEFIAGGQLFNLMNPTGSVLLPNASTNGCDSLIIVSLQFDDLIEEDYVDILCEGEEINLNGIVYNFNNPSGQQGLISHQGCDSILNVDLVFINSSDSLLSLTICDNEELNVNGTIFNATNTSGVQTLSNAEGCDSILTIDIRIINSTNNTIQESLCEDAFRVVSGQRFDISNPSGTIILENGNAMLCDSFIFVDFTFHPKLSSTETFEICEGDSLFVVDEWLFSAGIFIDSLITQFGCDSIINTTITQSNCNVDLDFEILTEVSCFGGDDGSLQLTLSGNVMLPYRYELLNNSNGEILESLELTSFSTILSNLSALDYTFLLYDDSNQVINTLLFSFQEKEELEVMMNVTHILCNGDGTGSINLSVSGGTAPFSYMWNNGGSTSTLINLGSGDYFYTVTDINGCTLNGDVTLTQPEPIEAETTSQNSTCNEAENGSIQISDVIGGLPGYSFSLDGVDYTTTPEFINLGAGNYEVIIQDQLGCQEVFNILIEEENPNSIDELLPQNINLGDSINIGLNLDFLPVTISWSPFVNISCNDCLNPTFFPEVTSTYIVNLTDDTGCSFQEELVINVLVKSDIEMYIPNIFNPDDAASSNNIFRPLISPTSSLTINLLSIYDRWGNLIHHEEVDIQGWDGRINDHKAEQGIYLYVIEYSVNNRILLTHGELSLVR